MEGLSYLRKNFNIVENRFIQQSVKSKLVLGNTVSAVGKESILAFWRPIHLAKYLASPLGLGKSVTSNTKVTEGGKKNQAAGQGSTRSQNTCQIEFSSRKGPEISSSVYGTTRCLQCSFYLALAESKRFRLGHIRNGKISDRLYPKRKDFISLNVAI